MLDWRWTEGRTDRRMNEWTDRSKDKRTDRRTDIRTNRRTERRAKRRMDRRTDERTDGHTDGQADEKTVGQTDGWTDGRNDGRERLLTSSTISNNFTKSLLYIKNIHIPCTPIKKPPKIASFHWQTKRERKRQGQNCQLLFRYKRRATAICNWWGDSLIFKCSNIEMHMASVPERQ